MKISFGFKVWFKIRNCYFALIFLMYLLTGCADAVDELSQKLLRMRFGVPEIKKCTLAFSGSIVSNQIPAVCGIKYPDISTQIAIDTLVSIELCGIKTLKEKDDFPVLLSSSLTDTLKEGQEIIIIPTMPMSELLLKKNRRKPLGGLVGHGAFVIPASAFVYADGKRVHLNSRAVELNLAEYTSEEIEGCFGLDENSER